MHTCKVTIGSVFALALLVLNSSCGGGGGMANGGGGAAVAVAAWRTAAEVPGPRLQAFTCRGFRWRA